MPVTKSPARKPAAKAKPAVAKSAPVRAKSAAAKPKPAAKKTVAVRAKSVAAKPKPAAAKAVAVRAKSVAAKPKPKPAAAKSVAVNNQRCCGEAEAEAGCGEVCRGEGQECCGEAEAGCQGEGTCSQGRSQAHPTRPGTHRARLLRGVRSRSRACSCIWRVKNAVRRWRRRLRGCRAANAARPTYGCLPVATLATGAFTSSRSRLSLAGRGNCSFRAGVEPPGDRGAAGGPRSGGGASG